MVRSNRKVDRMKKWRKFLLAAALLLGIFCIWFFTGNTTIQGGAVDRLVVSSIPRMDLQKVTEDPEDIQEFAGRWNRLRWWTSTRGTPNGWA